MQSSYEIIVKRPDTNKRWKPDSSCLRKCQANVSCDVHWQGPPCWRCSTLCSNTWGWAWTLSWATARGGTPPPAFRPSAVKRARSGSSRTPSSRPSVRAPLLLQSVFVLMNMCLHVLVKITLNVFFIHWVLTHLCLPRRRRQASSVGICQTTSELKSWCSSWAKCQCTGRPATPWTQSRLGESHIHYPETRRFPRRAAASQLAALKRCVQLRRRFGWSLVTNGAVLTGLYCQETSLQLDDDDDDDGDDEWILLSRHI